MNLLSAVLQEVDKASTDELKKRQDLLIPKIKDLIERVQLLTFSLQQNFIDTYINFTPTKSLEQLNYKNRKTNIDSDYANLNKEVESLRKDYDHSNDEFSKYFDKMCKSYEMLNDLCVAVEGKKILEQANHEFDRYNYSDAMLGIMDLKKQLRNLKLASNLDKALANLNEQAENQLALYTANVSVEWEDIFTWSEQRGVYYLKYSLSVQQSDPILIQRVLKTLHVTERLNAELGLFSNFFIEKLLHNVIKHNCDIFTDDHIGAVVFNIKIDLNDNKKPNYQTIFNNLTAVFEFLQSTLGSHLIDSDQTFIEIFAESIRKKFFDKIIEDCIKNNLPTCDSTYQNYKNIVIELDSFNKFLIELKFVKADESPLNKYINDTECVLYNKKCDKLLSDVRSYLFESLSYATSVVGSESVVPNDSILDVAVKEDLWNHDKPLFLPKCIVSQNVKKIMALIVEHLEESVKLPERYSQQLVVYIKDVAVMYQCVVPKKFKINLECCPLDIALFFNNCFYLAHSLLGPPWKVTLPSNLSDQLMTVLLESIQNLRVLGLEKMSLYLQNQKNIITQKIETEEPTEWTHESYDLFDNAVNSTMTLLKELKTSWFNVLPASMYEMSICTLIQALCQSILHRVFADSRQINEELVYMLAVRLEDVTSEFLTLFEEPIQFENKINVWNKFTMLPQLLKAQLLETADLWNRNKEFSQCYTCEEIRQITAFVIIALVIVVNQGRDVTAEGNVKVDQIAEEAKNIALTIIDNPKYVVLNDTNQQPLRSSGQNRQPEHRPPSKPPLNPDKPTQQNYGELQRLHYSSIQKVPLQRHYYPQTPHHLYYSANSVYKFPKVIPLPPHKNAYYIKKQQKPLAFASSTNKPIVLKSPKFSLPVQTITGVRKDIVKPPPYFNTTTTTTTVGTTTKRPLRVKRIWPKKILEKMNATLHNTTASNDTKSTNTSINQIDYETSETAYRIKYVHKNSTETTTEPTKKRQYRPVTRLPKIRSTTTPTVNLTEIEPNDWIPLVPSHYSQSRRPVLTRITKRSDTFPSGEEPAVPHKRMLYLHSFGLIPVDRLQHPISASDRKKMTFFRKRKRQLNPYSGYSPKPVIASTPHYFLGDLQAEGSQHHPKVVTKIKHHHHHHHHRYIKTVEKPVKIPYKVEVPKPYPVPVEKKVAVPVEKLRIVEKPVPYPVTVEKKVPYPVGIKVPHPVPVKVIEKEYVPKPYPIVHHVPVLKQVEVKVPQPVPVHVEKKVPYPVEVHVPVDRPVPVPVTVEKRVPYAVPVKVLVPQPYPVETKVPYPVQVKVKEPFEVIKHVPIRVPVPQPFAVKVPQPVPVPVEKKVPYPVEVEKKVPVPFEVIVPQKVEVEKKVPIYIPKPYPVEKKVPVPVKVPYPVKVPVKVPVQVPIEVPVYIHDPYVVYSDEYYGPGAATATENAVTHDPTHSVTVHGNTGFTGFKSRSDTEDSVSTTVTSTSNS
ncbi:uncharacterized protein LOC113509466 [Galleria mellonella]|uniref:Uncharacterized protein LOC113509466 n=1 Tax=Galleria mellonella TaxID=7137 RepID=A0A6J3BZ76_GALME|nr:uncharacterized protein LOC113509466 [Galleria mellonella]